MIKVLFICHGNICRSPMSEFVLKDMVEQRGLTEQFEILAIQCDQAFGIRSEVTIPGIGMEDINTVSLQTYRRSIQQFNSEFAYNNLNDEAFCRKIGAVIDGLLTEFIMIA